MDFNTLIEILKNTFTSEKILMVILPVLLSTFLLPTIINIWKYFFNKRRTQRIKNANEELTKILIFYIIEGPDLTKETIQSLKEGLASKHNIAIADIQSIETGLKKTHSYILLSNEFSIAQKNRFYFHLKKRSETLIAIDYLEKKLILSHKKIFINSIKVISIMWGIYLISTIISFLMSSPLSVQWSDIFSIVIISGFFSFMAFIFSELLFKLLEKITLWF